LLLTLTSDLICYLFLPVQLLLFFASIHVWLQFAYQTIDRGLNPIVLLFWGVFLFFEYFFRYKMTSPQWYQSRSVMVATSLFPAMTEFLDAFLANQMSTTRLTLYRLFASHALGFPLVTLSFRLKTIISNWLYERCRTDVQKKNEIFDQILTEALPAVYDGKKRHELNSRPQQLAIEGDALDFELDPTGSDLLDEPRLCLSSNGPVPSIFDKLSTTTLTTNNSPSQSSARLNTAGNGDGIPFNRKATKLNKQQLPMSSSSYKNGNISGKKSLSSKSTRNGRTNTDTSNNQLIMDDGDGNNNMDDDYPPRKIGSRKSKHSSSSPVISLILSLINLIQRFFVNGLLSFILKIFQAVGDIIFKILNIKSSSSSIAANSQHRNHHQQHQLNMNNGGDMIIGKDQQQQDDMISISGDGSQRSQQDDDYSDGGGDEIVISTTATTYGTNNSTLDLPSTNISNIKNGGINNSCGKKKGKQIQQKGNQSRGRTPTIDGEFEMPLISNGTISTTPTNSTSTSANSSIIKNSSNNKKGKQQQQNNSSDEKQRNEDDAIDKLKIDLRGAKLVESELREQIAALCQVEKSCKNEVQQYKQRYDQLDLKYKTLTKQQEQNKVIIANMEKRITDAQQRKDQLEKELALERCLMKTEPKSNINTDGKPATVDGIIETLKVKITKLETDLRKSRSDVKNKEDYALKLESKLKEVNNQKSQAQKFADDGSLTVNRLQHENINLIKALSEENRIKQDLFKALKTSKAQIDALKARLNVSSDDGEVLLGSGGRNNSSPSSSTNINGGGGGDMMMFRDSPITTPPSPPPLSSGNLDHLISMTQTYCMPYPFSSNYNGIRSSPSEMRDSPTQPQLSTLSDPSLSHQQPMTSATRSS
jgi:hypothetical protein